MLQAIGGHKELCVRKNTKTSHEIYTLTRNVNFVDKFMYENVNNVNKV